MITLQQKQIWRLQEQQQKKEKGKKTCDVNSSNRKKPMTIYNLDIVLSITEVKKKIKSTLTQLSDPGRTGKKIIF